MYSSVESTKGLRAADNRQEIVPKPGVDSEQEEENRAYLASLAWVLKGRCQEEQIEF